MILTLDTSRTQSYASTRDQHYSLKTLALQMRNTLFSIRTTSSIRMGMLSMKVNSLSSEKR
jgi:hypothetical protein